MVAFYIALALISAVGVFLVARLLRQQPAKHKQLIGAWICLVTSAGFFLIYALEGEFNLFNLSIGLLIFMMGAVALIAATVKRSS
jgi:hypothetical protein